jgi:hypothetical protein
MATKTTVETWHKTEMTKDLVEKERQARLDAGATSSTISEDKKDWILTTVWPVI